MKTKSYFRVEVKNSLESNNSHVKGRKDNFLRRKLSKPESTTLLRASANWAPALLLSLRSLFEINTSSLYYHLILFYSLKICILFIRAELPHKIYSNIFALLYIHLELLQTKLLHYCFHCDRCFRFTQVPYKTS